MEPRDIRLRQLSRIYGEELTPQDVESRAAKAPDVLAEAFFHEAADSDDVTDRGSALEYLSARLEFFGDLIPATGHSAIREQFIARWDYWERVE